MTFVIFTKPCAYYDTFLTPEIFVYSGQNHVAKNDSLFDEGRSIIICSKSKNIWSFLGEGRVIAKCSGRGIDSPPKWVIRYTKPFYMNSWNEKLVHIAHPRKYIGKIDIFSLLHKEKGLVPLKKNAISVGIVELIVRHVNEIENHHNDELEIENDTH